MVERGGQLHNGVFGLKEVLLVFLVGGGQSAHEVRFLFALGLGFRIFLHDCTSLIVGYSLGKLRAHLCHCQIVVFFIELFQFNIFSGYLLFTLNQILFSLFEFLCHLIFSECLLTNFLLK
jgi:hypothetical protein